MPSPPRSPSPTSAPTGQTTLFIDESKSRHYVLAAAEVSREDFAAHRAELRSLVLPGQRRLHFAKESDPRRRAILTALTRLGVRVHVIESTVKREAPAREDCLVTLIGGLRARTAIGLVLERDASIERSDHRILYRELSTRGLRDHVEYRHEDPHREPLLWIPDAVAWCWTRGGDWRRRIAALLDDGPR